MLGLHLTTPLSKASKRAVAAVVSSFLLLHLGTGLAFAQSSARTIQRPLDQLIDEADVIVHGRVLSARLEAHPQLHNLMTVFVTMSVQDTYKGKPANSLTFRQYVWNTAGSERASEYRKGQEMVLLLRPVACLECLEVEHLRRDCIVVLGHPAGCGNLFRGRLSSVAVLDKRREATYDIPAPSLREAGGKVHPCRLPSPPTVRVQTFHGLPSAQLHGLPPLKRAQQSS